ncbi:MAG: MFS transporter [Thermodesulfovibrio sp.]|nr:MFS transporter [Thermodesulfovibrio sp.]
MIPNKKQILSWCFFDFAVSSYSANVLSIIFPVYYVTYIVGNSGIGDLWWGRAISVSMLAVAILSPYLGGVADYAGIRKRMLLCFVLLGAFFVASLSGLKKGDVVEGFLLIVMANISIESAIVFYNSFLPLIASREYFGRVSSWGFAIGYIGSILSLLVGLYFIERNQYELIWLYVSISLILFSLPTFLTMPSDEKKSSFFNAAYKGMKFIIKTFLHLWREKTLRKFFIAYFLYMDGVNTVIVFSGIYASVTIGFKPAELVLLFIVVQFTAFAGASVFAKASDSLGPRTIILISLILWITVCIAAFFISSKIMFFTLASVAGVGLGTIQASSRAYFSRFIPKGNESEYFGVYSMIGKTSAIIGPILFGEISGVTGSQRVAILMITIFFLLGFFIIEGLKKERSVSKSS